MKMYLAPTDVFRPVETDVRELNAGVPPISLGCDPEERDHLAAVAVAVVKQEREAAEVRRKWNEWREILFAGIDDEDDECEDDEDPAVCAVEAMDEDAEPAPSVDIRSAGGAPHEVIDVDALPDVIEVPTCTGPVLNDLLPIDPAHLVVGPHADQGLYLAPSRHAAAFGVYARHARPAGEIITYDDLLNRFIVPCSGDMRLFQRCAPLSAIVRLGDFLAYPGTFVYNSPSYLAAAAALTHYMQGHGAARYVVRTPDRALGNVRMRIIEGRRILAAKRPIAAGDELLIFSNRPNEWI